MTRDGFTLLAIGYTGAKAMKFKLAYPLERGDRLRPLVIVVGVSIIELSCFAHKCAKKIELVYLGFESSFMTNNIFCIDEIRRRRI